MLNKWDSGYLWEDKEGVTEELSTSTTGVLSTLYFITWIVFHNL